MNGFPGLGDDLKLSELVKPEALTRLAARFSALHEVGTFAINTDGERVMGDLDQHLGCTGTDHDPHPPCDSCTSMLSGLEVGSSKLVTYSCSSGLNYLRVRLENQLDPVGHIILGPFAQDPVAPGGNRRVAVMSSDQASRLGEFLGGVIEEVVSAHFQRYLSTKLSRECIADNLGELLDKEAELNNYEETLKGSEDLRTLF